MKKKIILSLIAVAALALGVVGFSAFEAHVINVTATIENALSVPLETTGLNFGTVFPEEVLNENIDIGLSASFLAEDRVDDVQYTIRQKPKCGVPTEAIVDHVAPVSYSSFPQVTEDAQGNFVCPYGSVMLPLLCPYLSKHEVGTENGINAFHGSLTNWTLADTISTQVRGLLSKAANDTSDTWTIDLHVPCFAGSCAQDNVIPANYQADPADEHQIFGCDLWIETTEISTPPTQGEARLIVNKVVVNNNGGNNGTADFQLKVDNANVVSGDSNVFSAGAHVVSETGVSGYAATFAGDCDNDGDVTLVAGQTKTCTITNDDIAPNITLVKVVDHGAALPTDFVMRVNGIHVPTGSSIVVNANFGNIINEDAKTGYNFVSITGDLKCPSVLGGTATLNEGEAITCTIHNSDIQ